MATRTKKKNVKVAKKALPSPFNNYWQKTNYMLFGLGVLFIFFGFYFMSLGNWDSTSSLVISPILLVIGFVVILPASILYRKKSDINSDAKA
jgi:membrane protein YdbS with pleckstrin-like domain